MKNLRSILKTKKIVFVCWGNVFRSPVAKAYLNKMISSNPLNSEYQLISAGVAPASEIALPWRFRWQGLKRGLWWNHQPRLLNPKYVRGGALVLAMDRKVRGALVRQFGPASKDQIFLFSQFLGVNRSPDIPDPVGQDDQTIREMFQLIQEGCKSISRFLIEQESQNPLARSSAA